MKNVVSKNASVIVSETTPDPIAQFPHENFAWRQIRAATDARAHGGERFFARHLLRGTVAFRRRTEFRLGTHARMIAPCFRLGLAAASPSA